MDLQSRALISTTALTFAMWIFPVVPVHKKGRPHASGNSGAWGEGVVKFKQLRFVLFILLKKNMKEE